MTNETTWTRASIEALLTTSNVAVERALLALYERQTRQEQTSERTLDHNKIGFTGCDGEIFSSFASQIQQSRKPSGQRLSLRQFEVCRKVGPKSGVTRIGRYANQLLDIAAANGKMVDKRRTAATARKPVASEDLIARQGIEQEHRAMLAS